MGLSLCSMYQFDGWDQGFAINVQWVVAIQMRALGVCVCAGLAQWLFSTSSIS